jgi:hypothetical protein
MSLLGPGKLVETSKYCVSLGNGISSFLSNAGTDSLAFPRFTDLSLWDRQEKSSESIGGRADWLGKLASVFLRRQHLTREQMTQRQSGGCVGGRFQRPRLGQRKSSRRSIRVRRSKNIQSTCVTRQRKKPGRLSRLKVAMRRASRLIVSRAEDIKSLVDADRGAVSPTGATQLHVNLGYTAFQLIVDLPLVLLILWLLARTLPYSPPHFP